jgi:hypothetical protein
MQECGNVQSLKLFGDYYVKDIAFIRLKNCTLCKYCVNLNLHILSKAFILKEYPLSSDTTDDVEKPVQ